MKAFHFGLTAALASLPVVFASCIKDEPLNAECDIEMAYIHFDNPSEALFSPSDSVVTLSSAESGVSFGVRLGVDLSALAPVFRLTAGATVNPASGSVQDFSSGPVSYVVTSEDGRWSRSYSVAVRHVVRTVSDTVHFDFEHPFLTSFVGTYYDWTEFSDRGDSLKVWASGNAGFSISQSEAASLDYPSAPLANGYDGKAARLVTRYTGALGAMFKMPIAAGNLFLGKFAPENALMDPMTATRFGTPVDYKPVRIEGYYTYAPGADYQDGAGKIYPEKTDSASIYAVFYRNQDASGNSVTLDGSNVLTSPLLLGVAKLAEVPPTDVWTPFGVDFVYSAEVDEDVLERRGYSMSVVFSSSSNGDAFEGAIGSALCVDKVSVICSREEK